MNKDSNMELCRKYGVRGFPSFVYVKAGSSGRIATKFQGQRSYEKMLKWMHKLMKMNGGVKLVDDEDPVFEKNPDELEDVLLDEDDEEEEAHHDYPVGIKELLDKNTGDKIDIQIE